MIVDRLANAARYEGLNPRFASAFSFLTSDGPATLAPGVHELDGFRVVVLDTAGKGRSGAVIERHVREIDIHYTVDGTDVIGWSEVGRLAAPRAEFNDADDYQLFDDQPELWVPVPGGAFSIQFPGDGHAPLGGDGPIRKVVLKIADA